MPDEPKLTLDLAKKHISWRRSLTPGLPELARRTFALRGMPYVGSGFHYGLERTLGRIIAMANSVDGVPALSEMMTDRVIYDAFLEDLSAAEAGLTRKPTAPPKEEASTTDTNP